MSDKRHEPRVAVQGRIYLTHRGRCREENLLNLSPSGVCLKSDVRISPGESVKLFLPTQNGTAWRMHMLLGTVVRRRSKPFRASEIAIELSGTASEHLASYRQFLLTK